MNEQEKFESPITKKISEDEMIKEKEVLQAILILNFLMYEYLHSLDFNIIKQTGKQYWSTIQRKIGHTSKFIQMLQNFQNITLQSAKFQKLKLFLLDVNTQKLSERANNLLKIVKSLLQYYSNPFDQSDYDDSQLTYQFQNEPPLSPIKTSCIMEQDSEIIMLELIKIEQFSTIPIEIKQSCQINQIRSWSPTIASSWSKTRTIQSCQHHRLSISISNSIKQQSSSQWNLLQRKVINQYSKQIRLD
ncbi:unnamed protein product [Paramecium octaurelia]|uniref:Uncharacterized protein n=1 Tax=Paramecium octaurelia TaxID=43137 RepID=A0A8S1UJM8_PAROT|nr:unnamed protein product [Paramecium octaurelia]